MHPVGDQLVLDEDGELGIERRQHLRRRLDDRDVDALPDEVLGHLEPDEPGADHDGSRGRDVDIGHETRRVFDGPERAAPLVAGDRRAHGGGAHAEHELVVADARLRARDRRSCGDRVCDAVDRDDLVVDPRIETEAVEQLLGRLEGEILLLFDQPAHEVGQAAVGEGDVPGTLEHGDGGVGIQATQARRGRHPSRDATDDHHTK